jgi:hypothetical protein
MLEAGGAGTDTQRAIPGSEPCQGRCIFLVHLVVQVVITMPGVRVRPGNGVWGVPRRVREGRRAVHVRGDNTGGQLPGTGVRGGSPGEKGPVRGVKSEPYGTLPMVLGRAVCQPEKRKVGGSTPPLTTTPLPC